MTNSKKPKVEESISEDYSNDSEEYIDYGKPAGKDQVAASLTSTAKYYLEQQIAEREKIGSALSTSNKSIFNHSSQTKLDAVKKAQGELQVTSEVLLKEYMNEAKVD